MGRYNANGGMRRSKSFSLRLRKNNCEFTRFVVALIEIKNNHGCEIASAALEKYITKHKLNGAEADFLRSLVL